MREAFHEQLESLFSDLAAISREVENAVHYATNALLNGDAADAEAVISADAQVDSAARRIEETTFSIISLQQPVAGDLRTLVAALRMVSELERMGDLSVHVAKIARLRVPEIAVPEDVRPTMARMGQIVQVLPAVEVHHVVQVAWALSFRQCAHLLGKDFLERVAEDVNAVRRAVGVGMVNWALHRRQHQHLVGSQV